MPRHEAHYVVKIKTRNASTAWEWCPPGESCECDERTARARFATLLEMGRSGHPVDGLEVRAVRIEDTRISAAIGHEAAKNVMLSQGIHDAAPVGPLADQERLAS